MAIAQDIIDEMRNILDNNISDPNSRRSGNWIYTDFPRFSSTKPRIGIVEIDSTYDPLAIGTATPLQRPLIQVTVMCEIGNKFDVDDDGEAEKTERVLDYLASRVEEVISNNQQTIRNNVGTAVRNVIIQNRTPVTEDEDNVKMVNIEFEAILQRDI